MAKDKSKYLFDGEMYGKGRLVLAVVGDYVSKHPHITFDELKVIFPDRLQGAQGVFSRPESIRERYAGKSNSHHFMKESELISLKSGQITVCVDWSVDNIDRFIDAAMVLGYDIDHRYLGIE